MIYQGDVDFKLKINGKQYEIKNHNEGSPYLKYVFAKMMIGEFDKSVDSPGFVAIYKKANAESQEELFTKKNIEISASQLIEQLNGFPSAVSFTAYVTFNNLQDAVSGDDTSKYSFKLITRDGKNILASIDVSAVSLSYITSGTTATLTWNLRIINKSEY